jgi:APA family basic amino acid/polyamine antiporter
VTAAAAPSTTLTRRLGFWSAIGLVVGLAIGSGIFRTPSSIAVRVPDPWAMLGVWLAGGVISLCGALSVAELSAALPHTGGWYVYLRDAWGRLPAFLFGWAQLILLRGTVIGGIAAVFGEYVLRSIGIDSVAHPMAARLVSAAAILVAAAVNIRGVALGAAVVGASTLAKCGGLGLMVAAAALLGGSRGATVEHFAASAPVDLSLMGLALISVLWAYDGFSDVTLAAGEVTNPERNLPRAIVLGTMAITTVYLAVNVAYLYVSPIEAVAASPLIAADTMTALVGRVGASFISVVVMVSTFGALMAGMLATPRVFFAMANDGLFFTTVARVHPRYGTPHVAIGIAAVLGAGFVLTQTFEQLADTFVLSIWPFYTLGIAGVYRLRYTRPDLARPYRTLGYPVTPAVFIVAGVGLLVNALWAEPLWTGVTFGIVLAGVPVYLVSFRSRPRS